VWKVNGNIDGNSTDGMIILGSSLPLAVYRSPGRIDKRRKVRVSVLLKGKFDVITPMYKKGKRIDLVNVERAVDFTLEPPAEYNYHISIIQIDSTISPFYGGLKTGLPVYYDTAKFDLNIKLINVQQEQFPIL
jgi:hypothetical protein